MQGRGLGLRRRACVATAVFGSGVRSYRCLAGPVKDAPPECLHRTREHVLACLERCTEELRKTGPQTWSPSRSSDRGLPQLSRASRTAVVGSVATLSRDGYVSYRSPQGGRDAPRVPAAPCLLSPHARWGSDWHPGRVVGLPRGQIYCSSRSMQ